MLRRYGHAHAGHLSTGHHAVNPPPKEAAGSARRVRPTWRSLPPRAKAFRVAHVAWGIVAIGALAQIWSFAIVRRRDRSVWASVAFLLVQGVALVIGRGDCPFGPFQSRLGDPVPMFELALPPRAAKAAIPVLFFVSVAGIVALLLRPPRHEVIERESR